MRACSDLLVRTLPSSAKALRRSKTGVYAVAYQDESNNQNYCVESTHRSHQTTASLRHQEQKQEESIFPSKQEPLQPRSSTESRPYPRHCQTVQCLPEDEDREVVNVEDVVYPSDLVLTGVEEELERGHR